MNARFAPSSSSLTVAIAAIGAILVSFISPHAVSAAVVIDDRKLAFTLTLPDGFVAAPPEVLEGNTKATYAFMRGAGDESGGAVMLLIEPLGGTIGRERLKPQDIPKHLNAELATATWNGFEIDQFIVHEQLNGQAYLTYNVQVPIKPQAIQLKLVGPAARKAELDQVLVQLLGNLRGQSNWLSSAAPATPAAAAPLASSPHYRTILLTVAIVVIVVAIALMWIISRHAPRGTLLCIAIGLYVASWVLIPPRTRVRELVLLQGVIRLIGFIGFILGLFDLFRKRPAVYPTYIAPAYSPPPQSPMPVAAIPPPPLPADPTNRPPPG